MRVCVCVSAQGRGVRICMCICVCCEQSLSSLFQFAGHTAPPVHNTGHPSQPTHTGQESVDQWSRVPTGTVVEQIAPIAAVTNATSIHSLQRTMPNPLSCPGLTPRVEAVQWVYYHSPKLKEPYDYLKFAITFSQAKFLSNAGDKLHYYDVFHKHQKIKLTCCDIHQWCQIMYDKITLLSTTCGWFFRS